MPNAHNGWLGLRIYTKPRLGSVDRYGITSAHSCGRSSSKTQGGFTMQLFNIRVCNDSISKKHACSQRYAEFLGINKFLGLAIAAIFVNGIATPAVQAKPCEAAKVEAGGKYVDETLACHAKAVGKGNVVSAACLNEAEKKFTATYVNEDSKGGCETIGDADNVKALVNPALTDLVTTLGGAGPSQCTKEKFLAAGDEARNKSVCQARALKQGYGFGVDPKCRTLAEEKFTNAFKRAETKSDCIAGTNDAQAINNKIDFLLRDSRATISKPIASCSPVEVTTVHGDGFLGNNRLALIENGTVPCLHVEEATRATCAFSTVSGHESGEWLESPQGNFAKTGQSLTLNGIPGGDYVIAAKVSDAEPAPCIEPTSMDVAGRLAEGTELVSTCVVEEFNQEWNALSAVYGYWRLANYTEMEVCSANDPDKHLHPDFGVFVRSYASPGSATVDTFCYSFYHAALNDLNGTERDDTLTYYTDEEHCHMGVSSGVEVPAAKRPATFSLPAPGRVNTKSLIMWRPVSPIDIGNHLAENAVRQFFADKPAFLAATNAVNVSGALPNIGAVSGNVTVGTVNFSLAPRGTSLYIGTAGTTAGSDWYPPLPGNLIALAYENLQVKLAAPVYSVGFEMIEPINTMPSWGGTPVDSTYQIVLFKGDSQVGQYSFNPPDDQLAFVGVQSNTAFDRVWIMDMTTDATGSPSPSINDDEYFGQFYTGTTPAP